jgi:hypothetical protein
MDEWVEDELWMDEGWVVWGFVGWMGGLIDEPLR